MDFNTPLVHFEPEPLVVGVVFLCGCAILWLSLRNGILLLRRELTLQELRRAESRQMIARYVLILLAVFCLAHAVAESGGAILLSVQCYQRLEPNLVGGMLSGAMSPFVAVCLLLLVDGVVAIALARRQRGVVELHD